MEQALQVMDQLVAAVDEEDQGMEPEHQLIVSARNAEKRYRIDQDFHAPRLNVQNVNL